MRALRRAGSDTGIVERVLRHYHADGTERAARVQWVEADLFDPDGLREAMQGVEHVYHSAAAVSFAGRDKAWLLQTNIAGTANVVDAAMDAGVRRLLHLSSTATVTQGPDGGPATVERPFDENAKHSAYAFSKYGAELEVYRGIAEGLEAVMVNPCVVLGPGMPGRSTMTMVERFRKGGKFHPVGGNAVVDARDVARILLHLAAHGTVGERWLLIGEHISYKDLMTLLARSAGKPGPTQPLPPWVMELAWRADALRGLFGGRAMITRHTAATASRVRRYAGGPAEQAFGPFISAEEAVANVARFLEA